METKDAYKQKLEAQLKEWSAQINLFAAKVENAGADVKLKYAQELDVLHTKQREAAKKIKELEDASGDTWEKVKVTADTVLDDLRTGIAQVISKFK